MKPRKYIVANKEQELAVLGELEAKGFKWLTNARPQEWLPSKEVFTKFGFNFPYVIVAYDDRTIIWSSNVEGPNGKVVFDGREEDKMIKKYKVTKEFMDELVEWRDENKLDTTSNFRYSYVTPADLDNIPPLAVAWWWNTKDPMERNNRLVAIISWLNGYEVFEVEKPQEFVVRSKETDGDGEYMYVVVRQGVTDTGYHLSNAAKFSTREEAESWANSHQVVIEVD